MNRTRIYYTRKTARTYGAKVQYVRSLSGEFTAKDLPLEGGYKVNRVLLRWMLKRGELTLVRSGQWGPGGYPAIYRVKREQEKTVERFPKESRQMDAAA